MSQPEIGITDEDREKMGVWAERGHPSAGGPRGQSTTPLPKPDHPVVVAVRERLDAGDERFVTAADLAEGLPYSVNQVGKALSRLQQEGGVEKFNQRTWLVREGSR